MDDKQIIELYLARSDDAISVTAAKYSPYCMKIAFNILRNHEDSEECVNDTWLRTWNSIPPNIPRVLSTFIGRITRNLAIDRYRYLTSSKHGGSDIPLILDELSECLFGIDNIERTIDSSDITEALNSFLETLSQKQRIVFVRRYWYSWSVSEISSQMSISETNVTTMLMRIRKKLKSHLNSKEITI
jgi:RNA polymerase sigma-70 factor (ECF subfamily)